MSLISRRNVVLGAAMLALSACAAPAPKESALDAQTRQNIKLVKAVVDVTPMGPNTKGRVVPSSQVKAEVQMAANAYLANQGAGGRPVIAKLVINSVDIITAAQSMSIGGESIMAGTVEIVDAKSGEVILSPQKVESGGGRSVIGGIVGVATRDDANTEIRQMAQEFVARARIVVLGKV